jgi:hypothetical protein
MSEVALHGPYAPEHGSAPAHARSARTHAALHIGLIGLICFCTLWRLPMFFDPPWRNDVGTYANAG